MSLDAEASRVPSDETVTELTTVSWHFSRGTGATLLLPSHSLTVESADAEAILASSDENATELTSSLCPCSVIIWVPVVPSHSLTVLSFDAEAIREPSEENVMDLTKFE
jgi:hypothetical protein